MSSEKDRLPMLVIVLCVLLVALYTSRTATPMLGLLVALVGLGMTYLRPVLGIPVVVAMAIVAAVAPWGVLLVMVVAGLLTLATKAPQVASKEVNPAFAMVGMNAAGVSTGGLGDGSELTGGA